MRPMNGYNQSRCIFAKSLGRSYSIFQKSDEGGCSPEFPRTAQITRFEKKKRPHRSKLASLGLPGTKVGLIPIQESLFVWHRPNRGVFSAVSRDWPVFLPSHFFLPPFGSMKCVTRIFRCCFPEMGNSEQAESEQMSIYK